MTAAAMKLSRIFGSLGNLLWFLALTLELMLGISGVFSSYRFSGFAYVFLKWDGGGVKRKKSHHE